MISELVPLLVKKFPDLEFKLQQAEIKDSPEEFVKKCLFSTFFLSACILILFIVMVTILKLPPVILLLSPIIYIPVFLFQMKSVNIKIKKRMQEIDKDVVPASRNILIGLQSGITLFDTFREVSTGYGEVSEQFEKIIKRVEMGVAVDRAILEVINLNPSPYFQRVMWQIINSVRAGSDVSRSLDAIINQITKEQLSDIKEYGQKLNPMAMFYMISCIIFPSLGVSLMLIITTFLPVHFSFQILIMIIFLLGIIQFMFLSMVRSIRPSIGI